MRDFFVNAGKFYVPPKRDLTSAFCKVSISIILLKPKEIFCGTKKLLKLSHVLWVEEVPRLKSHLIEF